MRLSSSVIGLVVATLVTPDILLVYCKPTGWNWIARVRGGSSQRKNTPAKRFYVNDDDDDDDSTHGLSGKGREFDLFSGEELLRADRAVVEDDVHVVRGGAAAATSPNNRSPADSENSYTPGRAGGRSSNSSGTTSSSNAYRSKSRNYSGGSYKPTKIRNPFTVVRNWVRDNQASIPRIQVRVEPNTTVKLRKRFSPLFKTVVTLGADFNTQLGVWQFKSSWEDKIIGGRLTLAGRELQLSKTWLLSVGAVEDLVTRLRFRAAIDLGTAKAYARVGFRSERLSPINVMEGFSLLRQLPLDGPDGYMKLEVKANFAFPEPEIEYSTEKGGRSLVGMGDIEVNIDELNLLLEF